MGLVLGILRLQRLQLPKYEQAKPTSFRKIREQLSGVDKKAVEKMRADKKAKVEQMQKQKRDSDSEKLANHLAIAKAAAEGKKAPLAVNKIEVKAAPAPVKITVAPSKPAAAAQPARTPAQAKPKVNLNMPDFAKTGLTHAGFKPLQKARPTPTITISVAAPPKVKPPKVETWF